MTVAFPCALPSVAGKDRWKGDYRLAYKDVRKLMKVINEAGFTRVGLVTEKKKT